MKALCVLALLAGASAKTLFTEDFSGDWKANWVQSTHKSDFGKVDVSAGKFYADAEASKGLQTTQDARFYGVSRKLPTPVDATQGTFVFQFETKHEQNIDCGGGYFKLLPTSQDLTTFHGESPYYIMFGSDICGATKRVHLIFNHNGENLLWKKTVATPTDDRTHLFTLVLNFKEQSYEFHLDGEKKESGALEDDWDFLKPKEIDDPSDKKPADWVDSPEMDDPEDVKPAGYDDIPATISDPDAKKPDDWDTDEDGEWEAPTIANPEYKGEWKAKRIPNPDYKGVWAPKRIPNPDYKPDNQLAKYTDIGVVGLDVWQVKSGTIFDNLFISDSLADAEAYAKKTFHANKDAEKAAKDAIDAEATKKAEADAAAAAPASGAADAEDDDEL